MSGTGRRPSNYDEDEVYLCHIEPIYISVNKSLQSKQDFLFNKWTEWNNLHMEGDIQANKYDVACGFINLNLCECGQ